MFEELEKAFDLVHVAFWVAILNLVDYSALPDYFKMHFLAVWLTLVSVISSAIAFPSLQSRAILAYRSVR